MPNDQEQQALLKNKIVGETAKIPWRDLQRFFAQGRAILVSNELDLVEIALSFSSDQANEVKEWMEKGQISAVSDDQARLWYKADASVWAVVVRPWVLIQNIQSH